MKYLVSIFLFASFLSIPHSSNDQGGDSTHIQVALLLDTSNSMDGLIDQAKSQLWHILNTLSNSEYNQEDATMEIALYHYGNSHNSARNGYVRQLVPFTTDMDLISEQLFALKTSGGEEYCAEVIYKSLTELEWNPESKLRMMYIAGNESFNQGSRNSSDVLAECRRKGIMINTIFCGSREEGISMKWEFGAEYGMGSFNVINQNDRVVFVETPYDAKIAELNIELNSTYIPINSDGQANLKNMRMQDSNAKIYGTSNLVSRSIFKSKKAYNNSSWDLVDAYKKSKHKGYDISALPEEYRNLSDAEREAKIISLSTRRKEIQQEIGRYSQKRTQYLSTLPDQQASSLGDAISQTVLSQLRIHGFDIIDPTSGLVPTEADDNSMQSYPETTSIDFGAFTLMSTEVMKYRESRKIDIVTFYTYATEENTIILDTRSKEAFDQAHLKGAIHLNFSDFTEKKLATIIPSKNTRILIYCNNNFQSSQPSLLLKSPPLALNIPTFINLYGYGYKNIYELKSLLDDNYKNLEITGFSKVK